MHIGKSSAGWCFALHVDPDEGINGLEDWEARWSTGQIEDEYGDTVTPERLRSLITERWWTPRQKDAAFYASNHAEPGPKGLLRSRVDGRHCVGHGEGTWDLIAGEFS